MTTALATANGQEITQERAGRGLELLRHSLPSLSASSENAPQIKAAIKALSIPANSTWTMARVAALLDPYYEKDTPQAIRKMIAEDWAEALDGFPKWAIERAVRWWKSAENADRRKRPLEGDIAARCIAEMAVVRAAEIRVRLGKTAADVGSAQSPRVTADAAREILARAGYAPKAMEGGDHDAY